LALTPRVTRATINTTTSGRRCRTTSTARMLYLSGEKTRGLHGHFDHRGEEEIQIGNVEDMWLLMPLY